MRRARRWSTTSSAACPPSARPSSSCSPPPCARASTARRGGTWPTARSPTAASRRRWCRCCSRRCTRCPTRSTAPRARA
eukprot:442458-Prymnesium_polylepis.1